jgi:hypothetical protein
LEEGEDIELLPTDLDEAIRMIHEAQIVDAKTIAALLMFHAFHRDGS